MEAIEVSALRIGRFASPPLRQAGQSEPWTTTEVPLIEELANADHGDEAKGPYVYERNISLIAAGISKQQEASPVLMDNRYVTPLS